MSDWHMIGLTAQQAATLHFSGLLRRWNPQLRRRARVRGVDWLAPLAPVASLLLVIAVPHRLTVLVAVLVAAAASCTIAVRSGRRRQVLKLAQELAALSQRHDRRRVESLVVRCSGNVDELERRLARL